MHSAEKKNFMFLVSLVPCEKPALRAGFPRNVLGSSNINTSYLSGRDWRVCVFSRFGSKMIVCSLHMCIFSGIKLIPVSRHRFYIKKKKRLH